MKRLRSARPRGVITRERHTWIRVVDAIPGRKEASALATGVSSAARAPSILVHLPTRSRQKREALVREGIALASGTIQREDGHFGVANRRPAAPGKSESDRATTETKNLKEREKAEALSLGRRSPVQRGSQRASIEAAAMTPGVSYM